MVYMVKKIYFIRHGETKHNLDNIHQGCYSDLPLNDTGKQQSNNTGQYLKQYRLQERPFDAIYTSTLLRANETADIINTYVQSPNVIPLTCLRETCQGILDGVSNDDPIHKELHDMVDVHEKKYVDPIVREKLVKIELDYKLKERFGTKSRLYETCEEVFARVDEFLDILVKSDHNKIIVVTHSGLLSFIVMRMFNFPILTNTNLLYNIKKGEKTNCGIMYIHYDEVTLKYKLISGYNIEHLKMTFED